MALDLVVQHSRRALLAGGAGALAAFVARALGRPLPARADGETIVVGGRYTNATSVTYIENSANDNTVLECHGDAGGFGIAGSSNTAWGVSGFSDSNAGVCGNSNSGPGMLGVGQAGFGVHGASNSSYGVFGQSRSSSAIVGESDWRSAVYGVSGSSTGIHGRNFASDQPAIRGESLMGSTGVFGHSGGAPSAPAKTGVFGYAAQDVDARGVWGQSTAGRGVYGVASSGMGVRGFATSGRALSGQATTGIALHSRGRVQLEQSSGASTIAAGTKSQTVTPGFDLTSATKVWVSLMGNPGGSTVVQRIAVNANADTFTVYLTANATASTKFAWLVLM